MAWKVRRRCPARSCPGVFLSVDFKHRAIFAEAVISYMVAVCYIVNLVRLSRRLIWRSVFKGFLAPFSRNPLSILPLSPEPAMVQPVFEEASSQRKRARVGRAGPDAPRV